MAETKYQILPASSSDDGNEPPTLFVNMITSRCDVPNDEPPKVGNLIDSSFNGGGAEDDDGSSFDDTSEMKKWAEYEKSNFARRGELVQQSYSKVGERLPYPMILNFEFPLLQF